MSPRGGPDGSPDGPAFDPAPAGARKRASKARFVALLLLLTAAFAAFVALGVWQVHRRAWKLDLIAKVDARVHAPPVPAPGPRAWPRVDYQDDAYRHVTAHGRYRNGSETLVQAVTDLGPGFWVVTPFVTDRGFTILVNRGFVTPDRKAAASRQATDIAGETRVTGLLRISEPGGGFLRHNDPVADRWYSRDVAAIAKARHLGPAAPYFIDADREATGDAPPVGGLTVISFYNHHLSYALTWFGMAILSLVGIGILLRERRRTAR